MNVAYTVAFATPFQFGMQGIQYGIKDGEYGQDGQLHNVKIQGIRKRKCRECNNYPTIGTTVRIKRLKRDVLGSNPCEKSYHSCAFILKSFKNVLGSNPCEKVHSCAFIFESLRSHNQETNKG